MNTNKQARTNRPANINFLFIGNSNHSFPGDEGIISYGSAQRGNRVG